MNRFPYAIAVPHRFPAYIVEAEYFGEFEQPEDNLHAFHMIADDADEAELLNSKRPDGTGPRYHQAYTVAALIRERREEVAP